MASLQPNLTMNHCAIRCTATATKRTLTSPLGNLNVTFCAFGLSSLTFESVVSEEEQFFVQSGTRVEVVGEYEQSTSGEAEKVLAVCLQWLNCFFHQPKFLRKSPTPPICWISTDTSFRGNCLRSLGKIAPFGSVISYSDLAAAAGNSAAGRAAGTSMRTNPIAILIPCHRVITKSGETGKYAGGVQVKRFLLDHEKKHASRH